MRTGLMLTLIGALAAACSAQETPPPKESPPPKKAAQKPAKPPKKGDTKTKKAEPPAKGEPTTEEKPAEEKQDNKAGGKGDKKDEKKDEKDGARQDTAKDDTTDDKKDEKADEEEKTEKVPFLFTELGWADWGLSGQERKFRQYATPPSGWFLRDFRYAPVITPRREDVFLTVKSLGQPDYLGESRVSLRYGETLFKGLLSGNRFFSPTPGFVPYSERRVDELYGRQFLTPEAAISLRYRLDTQNEFFDPPRDAYRQNTRFRDVMVGGRLGNGYADLGLLDWHYQDKTGVLPETVTRGIRFGYLWNVNPNVGIETAFSRLWIQQSDRDTGRVDTLALNGDVALSRDTDLGLQLRQRVVSLPVVQNAYVREQRVGALRLNHRGRGWSTRLGLRLQEAERLRRDQTFVDVPRWWTVEGSFNGKLNRNLRVRLRGSTQRLSNTPIMQTDDPRSLYYNGRHLIELNLDGSWPNFNGYINYAFREWTNDVRAVDLTTHAVTVGGDWQVAPNLNLFAEYAHEAWTGKSEITVFPNLLNFTPDSRILALGLNWNINERAYLSLSYSDYATYNDNPLLLRDGNTRGRFLTLNGRYLFPNGLELGLLVAPWTFRDQVVNTMDYDATVAMMTVAFRF